MPQTLVPKIVSFTNLDLYQFNKVIQSWNIDFLQLSSGKFLANLKQYNSKDYQLDYAMFNKVVKQEGFSPEGVWTFAFVNEVKIYWRNYKVQPKSVIIYSPGSEINAISDANFEVMTFSVSEDYLMQVAKAEKMEDFFFSLKSIDVLTTKNPLWDTLRKAIWLELIKQEQYLDSKSNKVFREFFTKNLFELLKNSKISIDKVSGKKRLMMLHKAEKFILQRITEPIKVKDIAAFLNVSERTLLYAFQNRFDMGPKKFMLVLKLNHVHFRLRIRKNKQSIADIARDSGFWHLGQFYKDYKMFFGELPSQIK